MSWDWRRRATWSSSSPADQSRSIRNPNPAEEGDGGGDKDGGGGEEGGEGLSALSSDSP